MKVGAERGLVARFCGFVRWGCLAVDGAQVAAPLHQCLMLLRAGAGYVRQQSDRGAAKHPRYETVYEKWLVGAFGDSGFMIRADGTDDVSQAKANSNALAALNAERRHR